MKKRKWVSFLAQMNLIKVKVNKNRFKKISLIDLKYIFRLSGAHARLNHWRVIYLGLFFGELSDLSHWLLPTSSLPTPWAWERPYALIEALFLGHILDSSHLPTSQSESPSNATLRGQYFIFLCIKRENPVK